METMSRFFSSTLLVIPSLCPQAVIFSRPLAHRLLQSPALTLINGTHRRNPNKRGLRTSNHCWRKGEYVAGEVIRQPKLHPILKFKKVMVIDENGENLGEMQSKTALGLAEGRDMKIVKVSQMPGKSKDKDKTSTPVFRIASGRALYQEEVAEKKKRARNAVEVIKEVHIGTKITDHDMAIKIKRIKDVLEKGKSVRVYGEVRAKGKWIQPEEYQSELDKRVEKLDIVVSSLEGFGVLSKDPKAKGSKEFVLFRPTPELIAKKEQRVKESLEALRGKRRKRKTSEPVNEEFLEVMGKELEEEMVIEEQFKNSEGSGHNITDTNNSVDDSNSNVNSSTDIVIADSDNTDSQ